MVTVRDNGTGISDDLFPRLFAIFEQSATNMARSKGGLGIGLALVKRFVVMHDGSVVAASDGEGRGAAFTVSLALVGGTAQVSLEPSLASDDATRALIVKDNLSGR